ncbi:sulfotransferase [Vitellibacter sp. q18]|nr:sulfotransferase [Aequorivita lutea]
MKEENLIFIISQPRSGSTYLQNLLSNNPWVNTCSEPWLLLQFANQIKPSLLSAGFNTTLANDAFHDYLTKFPELDFQADIKQIILKLYGPMARGYLYVIDKTPRYWELLEELPQLFPNSKIIVLKRHPVEVLRSIIKTWDRDTVPSLGEFANDLLYAPKRIHDFGILQRENPNVKLLKYEDLVSAPKAVIEPLYQWLGLEYSEAVLQTEANTKYKGKYGDPFQNGPADTQMLRAQHKEKPISEKMETFITGYRHYLTPDFLEAYGNYKIGNAEPTAIFNEFLDSQRPAPMLAKELAYVKNSTSFRLGKIVLGPFRMLSALLK